MSKKTEYNILFAVTYFGDYILIDGPSQLLSDYIHEHIGRVSEMEEFIDKKELNILPKEKGVYTATLIMEWYKANNWDEPDEWNERFEFKNVKRMEINYD